MKRIGSIWKAFRHGMKVREGIVQAAWYRSRSLWVAFLAALFFGAKAAGLIELGDAEIEALAGQGADAVLDLVGFGFAVLMAYLRTRTTVPVGRETVAMPEIEAETVRKVVGGDVVEDAVAINAFELEAASLDGKRTVRVRVPGSRIPRTITIDKGDPEP